MLPEGIGGVMLAFEHSGLGHAARSTGWLYPLAVFAPFPFVFLFPLLGVISLFFPHHPKLHFPPIQ